MWRGTFRVFLAGWMSFGCDGPSPDHVDGALPMMDGASSPSPDAATDCVVSHCSASGLRSGSDCDGDTLVTCGVDDRGCVRDVSRGVCESGCNPLGYCDAPLGDPVIESLTGATLDGAPITLTGRELGSHELHTEWLGGGEGRIESLALGTEAGGWGPGWSIGISSAVTPAHISDQRAHSGTRSIKSWVDTDMSGSWQSGFDFMPGTEFDEVYVSWWVYFNPISGDGSADCEPQWKIWRLNASPRNASMNNYLGEIMMSGNATPNGSARTNMYMMLWDGPVSDYDCTVSPDTCYPYGYPEGRYGEQWLPRPLPNDAGRWVRWEVYVDASSGVDVKDGSFWLRMRLPDERYEVDWTDAICTHRDVRWEGETTTWLAWTRFVWQDFWANCGERAEWFTDDVYLQFGNRAHLELGDAPRWEDVTHAEIQVPTRWTSTEITFTLNRGSFSPGDVAFLFVINEAGNVSPGYPVDVLAGP